MEVIKKLLFTLDLFGTTWEVFLVDEITKEMSEEVDPTYCVGVTNSRHKQIYIKSNKEGNAVTRPQEIQLTLLHELMHLVAGEGCYSNINDDEPAIEWFAKCLRYFVNNEVFDKIKNIDVLLK